MDDSEKTDLMPANDNPWYWLARLYGEQTGDDIDRFLAERNRIAWNRWVAERLSKNQRAKLIEKGFAASELTPFSDIEKKEHYAAVLKRSGREPVALPDLLLWIDFGSTLFEHHCLFAGYLFPVFVIFGSATFGRGIDFRLAIFRGGALFRSAVFLENADFDLGTFSGSADFESATFSGNTYFRSTTFSEDANFGSAKFNGYVDFTFATLRGDASFGSVTFSSGADFKFAKFYSDVDFVNTKFLSVTAFSKAVFRSAAPKFFGATLHEGTTWHGVEWPSATPNQDDDDDKKDAAQDQVYAYERLKQEMEKLKKHEDEQFFFRKELRARRELYTWRSTYWWLNFLYEKLSNYGYGVVRPLVAFAALFLVGFVLLALDPFGFAGKKLIAWDAALTSLANMFGSIPLKTLANYTTDKTFAYSAELFAIFQTIAGVVLLFLFFLALRNRFRLR
jgi:Pentapeptide repeats (9 copies)